MDNSDFSAAVDVTNVLEFTVNGCKHAIENPDPKVLLIEWLRYKGLTGTKFSCGQGGCGACTVIICPNSRQPTYQAINSCLRPLAAMHGLEMLTIEGIGNTPDSVDIVQETIAKYNGSQCGYCTPGFVCAMKSYLWNTEHSSESRSLVDIEDIFDGHLCRCTGYRPILCGMKTFSPCGNKKELENTPEMIIDPSRTYSTQDLKHKNVALVGSEEIDFEQEISPSSNEAINAPPVLCVDKSKNVTTSAVWMKLYTMNQLTLAINKHKMHKDKIRLVVGNTASGIQIYHDEILKQTINLHIADIPELLGIKEDERSFLCVGSAERIQSLYDYLKMKCSKYPAMDDRTSSPPLIMHKHMMRLATTEIRNAGSVGGNLYLAKKWGFPSDLVCVLMTLNATVLVKVAGKIEPKQYSMADFMSSDQLQLDGTVIIQSITVRIAPSENTFIRTYKVARRPQNAHPFVNAGFVANVSIKAEKFSNVRIVMGHISKFTQRMPKTEKFMEEHCSPTSIATNSQLTELLSTLYTELQSVSDAASFLTDESYHLTTARNLFLKYVIDLVQVFSLPNQFGDSMMSSTTSLVTQRMESSSQGSQDFCVYKDEAPISEPIVKHSALIQACGEAKYAQDLAMSNHDTLHGVYIFNTRYAHAKFEVKISDEFYKKFSSVVKVFTAKDVNPTTTIPSKDYNDLGPGFPGLPSSTMFAKDEVIYIGQPMGMVVAKDDNVARSAAHYIQDNCIKWYSIDLHPILDLKEAIEKKHFFPDASTSWKNPKRLLKVSRPVTLDSINWDQIARDNPDWMIVEGSQLAGSQYHFYMENQTTVAFPLEGGKLKVVASAQSPAMVQSKVAQVCQIPANNVIVEIPRLGGGYGGKEVQSQFVSVAASFCAHKLRRPVSVSLLRTEDMEMIGKRHEVLGKYKVAASKDGKIQAMELEFFSNGGCTYDASFPVMDLILLSADNAYFVPQFICKGNVCMTYKASNTAFRSFGVIQAMIIVESAIETVSDKLGLPAEIVRKSNFYDRNMKTPYNQTLQYCNLDGVWDHIYNTSDFDNRKKSVDDFNKKNKLKKRGIKMTPLKYGVSFTHNTMNQGGALLSVYSHDGTLSVNIGGVEMGQGLHTKMLQIAAYTLNVPFEYIEIGTTSTEKVPNASSTGASTGSDLNGGAVKNACEILRKRIEDLLDNLAKQPVESFNSYWGKSKELLTKWKNGERSWKGLWPSAVAIAFEERVSLSAQGFYRSSDTVQLSNEKPEGNAFYYFNYAAAVSEVEIDVLTGETSIMRSDIVYDAGHSLNPAIDIGQIEGGFVMGIGNVLTEQLIFNKDGRLVTNGTWDYKPPDSKTIPKDMRVTLYPGANQRPNPRVDHTKEDEVAIDPHGIQSSKATGEPPLVLANSVFFAVCDAVKAARKEFGLPVEDFKFDSPATVIEVQLACGFDPHKVL